MAAIQNDARIPMPPLKVLITGAAGLIGGAVWDRLSVNPDKYTLSGVDVAPSDRPNCHVLDLSDFEATKAALASQDVVIHLAARARFTTPWNEIRDNNIEATYNVFEAARLGGAKRVVYASSNQVVWQYETEQPYTALVEGRYNEVPADYKRITVDQPPRPSSLYAVSKVFGEALARHYSDSLGMSILCLRFAAIMKEDNPLANTRRFANWATTRDAAQMVQRCIDAPDSLRYDVFFVTSDLKWGFMDIEHPKEVLGFMPEDKAEDWREEFERNGGGWPVKAGTLPQPPQGWKPSGS
jgi:dTDP-4-dehydrorhamnose reductase